MPPVSSFPARATGGQRLFSALLAAAFALALHPLTARGQVVVVDDLFDNGVVSSNPAGIGTGFNSGSINSGASVTESGGKLTLTTNVNGARRAYATSKNGATIDTGSDFTRFDFSGLSFSQNLANNASGAADRLYIGIKGTSAANDMANNPDTGLYIQFESGSIVTHAGDQSWNGTSTLFYESATNVRTSLATWTFNTLNWDDNVPATFNFTPVLDISVMLNTTSYAVTISGDGINLLTGSLSGDFADFGVTNQLTAGYGTLFQQVEAPGIITKLDRYTAITGFTPVPEPSTTALLGLGSLALLVTTLRRKRTAATKS